MQFLIASHTDVGIKKKTNQDAYMIKEAQTEQGKVCFCVLCDGMGGLSNGELASATVIRAFEQWFETDFPEVVSDFRFDEIKITWNQITNELNHCLAEHVAGMGRRMGTTVVALLLLKDRYYIMNVGDSRAYAILDRVYQLTKDQSLVQQQIDLGRLSPEQAEIHPQRNVLLQCIGASDEVFPDFYEGEIHDGSAFLLCSDGFRHVISEEEMYDRLNPTQFADEAEMQQQLIYLTELDKARMEVDNISTVIVKVSLEG